MLLVSPSINIHLPDRLYTGAKVVYEDFNTRSLMVDQKDIGWVPLKREDIDGKYMLIPCEKDLCKDVNIPIGQSPLIMISGNLYNEIAQHYFLACMKDPSTCSLTIPINENGLIDNVRLMELNKILH